MSWDYGRSFHQKPHRSNGHLFITVLAYQLVQVIRRRPGGQGTLVMGHAAQHSRWPATSDLYVSSCLRQHAPRAQGDARRA